MNPTVGVSVISPCVFYTADGVCRQVHGSFKLWVLNHLSETQHNCQVVPFLDMFSHPQEDVKRHKKFVAEVEHSCSARTHKFK